MTCTQCGHYEVGKDRVTCSKCDATLSGRNIP